MNEGDSFTRALDIPAGRGVMALVGGGGKTSLMYRLGAEWTRAGREVIVTTTTRIALPEPDQARLLRTDGPLPERLTVPGQVICVGTPAEPGKLRGPEPGGALWTRCLAEARRLFVEADGAKRLPVKAPADHEPCIPPETDTVVAVAGLTALGRPLKEVGFRLEQLCALLEAEPEAPLTPAMLAQVLTSPRGQRKGVADPACFRVYLNQADNAELLRLGMETAAEVRRRLPGCRVAVGRLQNGPAVWTLE